MQKLENLIHRLDQELAVIQSLKYEEELGLVADIIRRCKEAGYWPYHRTPMGASLVAFLLGCVKENPMNHRLFPELLYGLGERKSLCVVSIPKEKKTHFCKTVTDVCAERGFNITQEDAQFIVHAEDQEIYIEYLTYEKMIWSPRGKFFETREALYSFLLDHSMELQMAYSITEYVRKGKSFSQGVPQEYRDAMTAVGISTTLIERLKEIQYLPSEAVLLQQNTEF